MKNIHVCMSWLIWCYLYLKLFLKFSSTWRIYTSVRVFFNYFYGRISTSMQVDYNGISTLETVFTTRIYSSVWVFFNFSLKNIYHCMSWKQYLPEEYTPLYECFQLFLLKNTFVWVDCNGNAFTWIFFLPEEYTPLYECFSISSVEEYLCVSWL